MDLPDLEIELGFLTLEVDSLSAESQEKPKNNRVGILSLLQGIFPIQESNWGLLHCRQILYQLSYEGSPWTDYTVHGILQAQNTGAGSLSLLQEIFPTQGLNPGLLHCRQILYQLNLKGSPRVLEWVDNGQIIKTEN